jgi:hypothetical protein
MKEQTGWNLKVLPGVKAAPEPSPRELKILRTIDVTGMLRKK